MALKKGATAQAVVQEDPPPTPIRAEPRGTGTRPSTLRFEERRHMYFDGRKWLPSVTGITGKAESKEALLAWHADTTATCAIKEAAELSRIRRLQGDDAAWEWLRKAPDRERDGKATKGSDLHDVADRKMSGAPLPEDLHPDIKAMAENVLAFMADYGVKALHSEVRLAHRAMGYAGTTDTIGIVPQYGELPLIIDWKTAESMYNKPKFSHGKNASQLAPYSRAEFMFWDDKTESDMIKVSQEVGLIVMIRPEGYKVYDYDLVRAWPKFERAFTDYHWWRNVDELARGPVRPSGLADNIRAAAERAESTDELTRLYDRAVHHDIWSEELRAAFTARRVELEGVNTAQVVVPAQRTKVELVGKLRQAPDEAALTALWEANQQAWDDDCTRMARARLAELAS